MKFLSTQKYTKNAGQAGKAPQRNNPQETITKLSISPRGCHAQSSVSSRRSTKPIPYLAWWILDHTLDHTVICDSEGWWQCQPPARDIPDPEAKSVGMRSSAVSGSSTSKRLPIGIKDSWRRASGRINSRWARFHTTQ
jgi:hypothetical protein